MPTQEEHFSHARHNLEFLESFFDKPDKGDWSITVSFYTVLHVVEGAIFIDKPHSVDHSDDLSLPGTYSHHEKRNYLVRDCYKEIVDSYMLLYRESKNSRYKKYKWQPIDVGLIVIHSLNDIFNWANNRYSLKFKLKTPHR